MVCKAKRWLSAPYGTKKQSNVLIMACGGHVHRASLFGFRLREEIAESCPLQHGNVTGLSPGFPSGLPRLLHLKSCHGSLIVIGLCSGRMREHQRVGTKRKPVGILGMRKYGEAAALARMLLMRTSVNQTRSGPGARWAVHLHPQGVFLSLLSLFSFTYVLAIAADERIFNPLLLPVSSCVTDSHEVKV